MTVWEFANNHPFIALILAYLLMAPVRYGCKYGFKVYNRRLRSKNIAAHGWPTAPVDADGDVVWPVTPEQVADKVIEKLREERRRA